MEEWTIPTRLGVKVGFNPQGLIRISQENPYDEDDVILVHPDDVSHLVHYLEAARQELTETDDS
jgi:hypothetical protein